MLEVILNTHRDTANHADIFGQYPLFIYLKGNQGHYRIDEFVLSLIDASTNVLDK